MGSGFLGSGTVHTGPVSGDTVALEQCHTSVVFLVKALGLNVVPV